MKKKQKIYILLLVLAGAGFILDRMTYDPDQIGPTQATAALQARSASATRKTPGAETLSVSLDLDQLQGPGLAELLERRCRKVMQTTLLKRDVFVASEFWKPKVDTAEEEAKQGPSVEELTLRKFAASHRLTATLAGANGAAILDDRVVRVGQVIDGCTLVEVTGEKAVFEAGKHRAIFFVSN
ncbi:MAG: hypothetical protein ACLFUJ_01325 [Phycisphaerae bacterium]